MMNGYASPGEPFARCIENAAQRVNEELRQAVDYVDQIVVPEVRRETSSAMRLVAGQLERWADSLHRSKQS